MLTTQERKILLIVHSYLQRETQLKLLLSLVYKKIFSWFDFFKISLLIQGLGVVGRDKYGVYPLRGKLLNVREATHKQIMENKEINELVKIIGLQYKKKYQSVDDLKTLRYGRLMIMTDQDQVNFSL
jgi:hypothetical protein